MRMAIVMAIFKLGFYISFYDLAQAFSNSHILLHVKHAPVSHSTQACLTEYCKCLIRTQNLAQKPLTKALTDNGHCEVHFLFYCTYVGLLGLYIEQKLSGDLTLVPFLMISHSQSNYSAKVSHDIGNGFKM